MAATLKQTDVGPKAYPRRSLCAGELHASWPAAGKFCVTHYLSIEGHKAGPHSLNRTQSLPASRLHLNVRSRSRLHAGITLGSFIVQEPISDRDVSHGTCLNEAVSRKSFHSLHVWTVTSAALCLKEEM